MELQKFSRSDWWIFRRTVKWSYHNVVIWLNEKGKRFSRQFAADLLFWYANTVYLVPREKSMQLEVIVW